MWMEDYQWHYDYVRLAWDTGFAFEKCKSPNLDKNKISVVDVDRIVKERDVASVDRYISTVVQYILEEEQAKVLDTNFVKVFRISQLAVEYLLFCKKYLDNTVVLLKKELAKNREENKELTVFIDDLQAHIDTLTKQQVLATFKCSSCSKTFSSEEYLNAHIKRRHNNESYNSETDKLNLEIKGLKERLNNTEKILKEKDEQDLEKKLVMDANAEHLKMTELLEKFEQFKNQMDNELKELKLQKSFYEEHYGKLFDIVTQNKENVEPKNEIKDVPTQTDKILQIENVNNKNVVEIQELMATNNSGSNSEIIGQTDKESLENKISTTLAGIENQMQAFWDKLNTIEQNNMHANLQPELSPIAVQEVKPKAKPRSKLTQPTPNTGQFSNDIEKLKIAIDNLEQQPSKDIMVVPQTKAINVRSPSLIKTDNIEENDSEEESESESDTDETESGKENSEQNKQINKPEAIPNKFSYRTSPNKYNSELRGHKKKVAIKPSLAILDKRPHSSPKNFSGKTINNLNKEVKLMMSRRLQELGISDNWIRLPLRSFDKAMEIINHQATLTKKTHTNFNSIKKMIVFEVEKQCNKMVKNKTELTTESPKVEKLRNIVKVSYRPKSGEKNIDQRDLVRSPKRKLVEIKNRAIYDTDTDSDEHIQQTCKKTTVIADINSHQLYSNVVDELKSLPNVKSLINDDSTDETNKVPHEGLPKKIPSVGSLAKKKVLFDLGSEPPRLEVAPLAEKTGGSSTSIASSILEQKIGESDNEANKKEKSNNKNDEKEFDNISDFDLSDLE